MHVGGLIDLTEVIRDDDHALVAPGALEVDLSGPADDEPTTYVLGTDDELVEVEAGVYRLRVAVGQAGGWRYRWRITDPTEVRAGEVWVSPTEFDTPTPAAGVTPTVKEVAAVLTGHRVDAYGKDQETFTDDTDPTARDAERAIATAKRLVLGTFSDQVAETGTAPTTLLARDAIACRAAMQLATKLPNPEPEYDRLERQYNSVIAALTNLVTDKTPRPRQIGSVTLVSPYSGDDEAVEDLL